MLEAALAVLDEMGRVDAVRPAVVAERLGIRSQSLYAHVDGSAGLRRLLALKALDDLATVVTEAAVGRSGRDAVDSILRAQLAFALAAPGRSEASIHPPGDDPLLADAVERAGRPLQTVLGSPGMEADQRVHWTRLQLALTIGFAALVRDGQLTLAPDPSTTVDHVVGALLDQLPTGHCPKRAGLTR